ncbi:cupin domain-containing protein [Photobacterium sanguinicancri]|uniref:cupin domain-containing protein n=1 Tax=Photobacterium sanguinicancri TaxID=875932 RepID=UPI00078763F3|nr:cupin domain-containing protein [Photobacterium sanguinicancri]KXI23426.1 cupin [Photobacterium sanguinicancri]
MLNMDLSKKVVINTTTMDWLPSPSGGVLRKPLERESAESGHTTSVVEYIAAANFPIHPHPLGEEIFVLEGIFSDETGNFPAGSYIRNPPKSHHAPFSHEGCKILVKLNQFDESDSQQVNIDTQTAKWLQGIGGLKVMPLHDFKHGARHEHTALVKWPAGETFQYHQHVGGEEIFVISGELRDEYGQYPAGTWLRSPHQSVHRPYAEEETIIFVKTGHLPLV